MHQSGGPYGHEPHQPPQRPVAGRLPRPRRTGADQDLRPQGRCRALADHRRGRPASGDLGRPGRGPNHPGGVRRPLAAADDADLAGGDRRRRPDLAGEAHPPGARPPPPVGAPADRRRGAVRRTRAGAFDRLRRVSAPVPGPLGGGRGRAPGPQSCRPGPTAEAGAEQGPTGPARIGRAHRHPAAGLDEGRRAARGRCRPPPGRGVRAHYRPDRLCPPPAAHRPPAGQPLRARACARPGQDDQQQPDHPAGHVRRRGALGAPGALPGRTGPADRADAERPVGGLRPLRPPMAHGLSAGRGPRAAPPRPAPHLRVDPAVARRLGEGGGGLARSRVAEDHPRHLRPPHAGRRGGGPGRAGRRPRSVR